MSINKIKEYDLSNGKLGGIILQKKGAQETINNERRLLKWEFINR